MYFKKSFLLVSIVLLGFFGTNQGNAQNKEALSFNDVRLWRTNAVTLSNNGEWYTTSYRLIDEPESKKDSILEKLSKQISTEFYIENNHTDVLYIHHSEDGLEYKITDGSSPKFSTASKWVAYKIESKDKGKVEEKDKEKKEDKKKKDSTFIELKHLPSAFTVRYESDATYSFPEDKNIFITSDDNSLLIYDLDLRTEHFIGNIGEFLIDRKSDIIAYTIASEDRRGNGIYLYNPADRTTRALTTGNFIFSNLSWNSNKNTLAAYKYTTSEKKIDYASMSIIVSNIDSKKVELIEYPVKNIEGLPTDRTLAVKSGQSATAIEWSRDGKRLFIKTKAYDGKDDQKDKKERDSIYESSVQVWHWKDQKLLSQRITESEKKKDETFRAIFFRSTNKIVPLTGEDIQNYIFSEGTDNWAIGTDNRKYLSDWDVNTHDLYRINLKTGEKKLIETKYRSRFGNQVQMSPDGTKAILWDEKDYWYYDIEKDEKKNITSNLEVSFIDADYDMFGWVKNYGFVGWVKDRNAVILNHKLDVWLIPVDDTKKAKNLTASVTSKDSIQFRFEDTSFADKPEIEDRYIDLGARQISLFQKKFLFCKENNGLQRTSYRDICKTFRRMGI